MPKKISPIEAALREYQDGTSIVVNPSKFVPITLDVHEEVEMMFALEYARSRAHSQGSVTYVSMREPCLDLTERSLHDALADGVDPIGAVGHVGRSYGQKGKGTR